MPSAGWTLTDHVCARCHNRILRRLGGAEWFCCAGCERSAPTYRKLCACGRKVELGGKRWRPCRCFRLSLEARELPHHPAAVGVAFGDRLVSSGFGFGLENWLT